jgi:DnaD/phage-associated family protein
VSLYLYRKSGAPLELAMDFLHFTANRMTMAGDSLRQLGLWESEVKPQMEPERPVYTEEDVHKALQGGQFPPLVGEAQRRLGRTLSTEELKILLSFLDYLRMPTDVVGLLLSFCVERCRRRGVRAPSMRSIEREAYRWADEQIDTLEAACYHVQTQLQIHSRIQRLRALMQIDGRRLTNGEEQYLSAWIAMGFTDEVIKLAYEKTCLNTGGLKWAYMNSILKAWNEKNLRTPQDIAAGDSAPQRRGNEMYQRHNDALSPLERQAVARALEEG